MYKCRYIDPILVRTKNFFKQQKLLSTMALLQQEMQTLKEYLLANNVSEDVHLRLIAIKHDGSGDNEARRCYEFGRSILCGKEGATFQLIVRSFFAAITLTV